MVGTFYDKKFVTGRGEETAQLQFFSGMRKTINVDKGIHPIVYALHASILKELHHDVILLFVMCLRLSPI